MTQFTRADEILELQKSAIGQILTFGEASLPADQFRAFKRLVLTYFHGNLKPNTLAILNGLDQVGAVPRSDNMGKKGGVPC